MPDEGLPEVTEITIEVDGDVNIKELDLHACNEPGKCIHKSLDKVTLLLLPLVVV